MKRYSAFLPRLALLAVFAATPAFAITDYAPSNLSTMAQSQVDTLIKSVGILGHFRAYQSASPLGAVIGLDVGVDVTALSVPDDLKNALVTAGAVSSTANAPSVLPAPRISIHKGLPWKLDVGGSWFGDGNGNYVWGLDLRYALLDGSGALPALGFRASYSKANLLFMSTSIVGLDAVVSKNLFIIDPYVGLGMQFVSGSLQIPAGLSLPPGISSSSSTFLGHIYVGVPLKLFVLKLTPEYDFNFAGVSTYGLKLSVAL